MSALVCLGFELNARDPQQLARFYCEALGFVRVREDGKHIELRLGACLLRLRAAPAGREMPADSRSHDRWFRHLAIVVRDMRLACARIEAFQIRLISQSAQTLPAWNPDAAGIEALYFRDPEGHPLELIRFPAGRGRAAWHRPGEDLFLGVDHSAIVVANTNASTRFYQYLAGLMPIAGAHNHGAEQERLSGVPGANLRVTTLANPDADPDTAPHLELLEYIQPRDGRLMPSDTQLAGPAADAWVSHTIFQSSPNGGPPPTDEVLTDPDGHRVLIL